MFERDGKLHVIDQAWKDQLLVFDQLKEGIGVRGYGQADPQCLLATGLSRFPNLSALLFQ
jgi:preprotein translocase subunit SecA